MTNNIKDYYLKIYDRAGVFLATIKDFQFNSFRSQINAGQGQLQFVLAKPFDDFDENALIKFNNIVELWVTDKEEPDGIKMYSGFITMYEPSIDGNTQSVAVNCIGSINKLATSILRNGSYIELKTDTATGLLDSTGQNATACEIATVVQTIIDRYNSEATNPIIDYDATSVQTTAVTMTYTFNAKYFLDAINICQQNAPAGWWWHVGADNILKFQAKPATPTHTFIFGRHFKKIDVQKNMESIVNNVIVSSNNNNITLLKKYSDAPSQAAYDDRWVLKPDNRIDQLATLDNVGSSELANSKDPDVRTQIEIADSNGSDTGYDIESIHIGDTCQLLGFNDVTATTFTDSSGNPLVLQIMAIDYSLNSVTLELESLKPNIARSEIKTQQEVSDLQTQENAGLLDTNTDSLDAPWKSWTPTMAADGGMTISSVTITYARYCIIGKICFFEVAAIFTTGGTASGRVKFSLPPGITSRNKTGSALPVFPAFIYEGATLAYKAGIGWVYTELNVQRYDCANWALKAGSQAHISGHFEIA